MKLAKRIRLALRTITILLGIGVPSLAAAADGRLAVVADGNYRDTDDVCGTPVSLAIIHSLGKADQLVHYSHSCDITPAGSDAGQGQESEREETMQISCDGTADRWGAFPNVVKYYNCKREYSAAVTDLKNAINASSASDLLYIIEAGEPDVIYDAMAAATQSKRSHVRIVTHHPNNDRGDIHDLSDIEAMSGFPANGVLRIPDQNANLKKDLSTWHWARDHQDCRISWLWDRGEIAQDAHWGYNGIRGSFDCSDAGMIWYWATGEDDCTMTQLRTAFTTFVNNNPIVASAEAEDAQISSGETKSSFDVSGQSYVDGSANFNLTWTFTGTAARYELGFFIHSPSGTRQMGVFVNNTKVGTISAGTAWKKDTVTANLAAGTNLIELRDSEGTAELDVDMLMLTSDTGSGSFKIQLGTVYNEAGGLVIMEMENTNSPLDLWEKQSSLSGHTGSGYLQFLGNTYISGDPKSPLEYTFKINQAGLYYLHMHCAKETHDGRTDVANDAYVRVEGDYDAGPGPYTSHNDNASLSLLKSDTKYYGGARDAWQWEDGDANLDPGGESNKRVAVYDFKAGETYKLVVSGRSKFFRIDRIMFRHTSVSKSSAENLSQPESQKISSGGPGYVYNAINDFPNITANAVDYYEDNANDALAIDASIISNRSGFARASLTFPGDSGTYQIRITTLTEEDGESTYRLLVNGSVVATFENPHVGKDSPLDMQPTTHVWDDIALQNGDTLAIESNCDTNGEVPENGGTAWSRGRWRQIELFQPGTLPSARIEFNVEKDLLLAQFDSKPDADDIHAQAALGSMLAHPDLAGVNFFAVAGAIGQQGGTFIDSKSLFRMAFGVENVDWTDASGGSTHWNASVTRIRDRARAVLDAGGKVWVQEAGQSDITADWIAALISAGVQESVIKENVIVVQHSYWNEDQTAPSDLSYVQSKANYIAIDDGNVGFGEYSAQRPNRGPDTPGYVSSSSSWLTAAKSGSNPNAHARALWTEADRIIDESGFNASYSEIPGGGVDFSDCVENWWIFNIEPNADSVSAFWDRYVVNAPSGGSDQMEPIAHWKLDEASGTVANDASGNGQTGTLLNGASWGSDAIRSSYVSFDGTDDRISTTFTYQLSSNDNFTWAFWANMQSAPGTDDSAVIVGNRYPERSPGNKYGFIKMKPTGAEFANASATTGIERYNYSPLPQGEWHHYAMVKSGNSYQWYVDGVAQGSPTNFTYSESTAIPFLIGGDDNGTSKPNEHFEGFIDDVVLYRRPLTDEDLQNVMIGIYTPVITPTAHWKLDEGSGSTAADSSGNAFDGTLLHGASWGSDSTRSSFVSFDGTDDRISTLFTYALSSSDDFTWTWWANQQSTGTTDEKAIMVGNRYGGTGTDDLEFIKMTPSKGEFRNGSGENYDYTDITPGAWHHYAMVKTGTSYQWYVDGVAQGTPKTINYSEESPLPFNIGGDDDDATAGGRTGEHFQGFIDDVALYSQALSPGEIADVMNGSIEAPQTAAIENWRQLHFGTTGNSGSAADEHDANFDGESNLLEFATSQDPHANTLTSTPMEMIGTTIWFRYTRSKAAMADGINFQVEWSDSLLANSWSSTGITESVESENTDKQHVVAEVPTGSEEARFLHLKVSP